MKVLSLFIKRKKGGKVEKIEEGQLKEGHGLVSNVNGGGSREISIATLRVRKYLEDKSLKGICSYRFYENITIGGLNVEELKLGQRIIIGDTILEITSIGKKCFPECNLFISNNLCPLTKDVLFTKIIRGGFIKIGDRVNLMEPTDFIWVR
ncbi:hypothetical protein [Tepidimicrobium xylanilyticum]|uniref:MOSC domain-containing protein n=1 Tax=Tepidimicrobium xylanilyticum TaxID=1123352 RepID=A0A1H3DHC1_9FIRM|nr:hypothetical protein [Tepidimicrobium xylanilyticum]GMG97350.1 hypothetical protein EN5CB1_21760 [Tepidimicrobium xylanilyticum]SDX65757.1 hypothetical protein SAMN05660923_02683 [Tepidimicrobium xylanilyticum]